MNEQDRTTDTAVELGWTVEENTDTHAVFTRGRTTLRVAYRLGRIDGAQGTVGAYTTDVVFDGKRPMVTVVRELLALI